MSEEKPIHTRIIEKRDKLNGVHAAIAVHMGKQHTHAKVAKVNELQDRLEYRISEYEEKLLDEKIKVYNEVLTILR